MPWMRAAVDLPFGAVPTGPVLRVTAYNKDVGASRIFPGDFVMLSADGSVDVVTAGTETNIIGVAVGGSANATADATFLVYDHPEQRFMVQDDSVGTFIAQTHVGNNANLVVTTGDTTTDRSAHELDSSSVATTTAPLRIMGLHPVEAAFATATGNPRKLIVKINAGNHILATAAGV